MELFPVGRLDKDTVGLMILTNNGKLAHRLLSPKHHVEKKYYFECAEELPDFYLESLEVTNILQELSKDTAQRRQFSRIFDDDWDQKYIQGMPIR
jgi:pseudouridine synthase